MHALNNARASPWSRFDSARMVYFVLAMAVLWLVVLNLFIGTTIDKFIQVGSPAPSLIPAPSGGRIRCLVFSVIVIIFYLFFLI